MENMNWERIQEEKPNAFGVLIKKYSHLTIDGRGKLGHYYTDGVHAVSMFAEFPVRNLYEFFDEQEIFVEVSVQDRHIAIREGAWYFSIVENSNDAFGDGLVRANYSAKFSFRTEAEVEAFTHAFSKLEERIMA